MKFNTNILFKSMFFLTFLMVDEKKISENNN